MDLCGELTVRTVPEVYNTLLEVLRQSDAVALNVAELDECDLTAVQLIECARRSASRDGKTITLSTAPSAALLNVLERAGLVGADADPSDPFWLQTSGAR